MPFRDLSPPIGDPGSRRIAEFGAGLKRAGDDPVEGDLLDALPFLNDGCRRGDAGVDERAETLAKALAEAGAKSFGGRIPSSFPFSGFAIGPRLTRTPKLRRSICQGWGMISDNKR
jgi:hypothetical protein